MRPNRIIPELTDAQKESFWSKVKIGSKNECWEWTASRGWAGYGQFGLNHKPHISSRIAWFISFGPIPEGICVLHHCDNPPCCNPAHLFLGTIRENALDMARKKRSAFQQHPESAPRGEKNGHTTLTDEQVREIRRRYIPKKYSQQKLADEFHVDQTVISNIILRKTWHHVL